MTLNYLKNEEGDCWRVKLKSDFAAVDSNSRSPI